jgi:hypothetical protein
VAAQRQRNGAVPRQEWIDVPPGRVTLGVNAGVVPFSWDNERPACHAQVGAFSIERQDVTNAGFLEFVGRRLSRSRCWRAEDWTWVQASASCIPFRERTGDAWWWRGMFDLFPCRRLASLRQLPGDRLCDVAWMPFAHEAEFQRAAYGTPLERAALSVGDEPPRAHTCLIFRRGSPPR